MLILVAVWAVGCMSNTKKKTTSETFVEELSGTWHLVAIKDEKVTLPQLPTLAIDAKEKQFSGMSGCNRIGGEVVQQKDEISFKDIFITNMLCEEEQMKVERLYTEFLEKVHFFQTENNTLILLDKQKQKVLTLERK